MDSDFAKHVHSSDIDWIEALFKRFERHEPLDSSWKYFFEGYQVGKSDVLSPSTSSDKALEALQEKKAQSLLMIYRHYGYLQSQISPLSSVSESPLVSEKVRGFDLQEMVPSLGLLPQSHVRIADFIQVLKDKYCRSIAVETLNCSPEIQEYIWKLMEGDKVALTKEVLLARYREIKQAGAFEEFLQIKFTGQKRFSLEGGESLIPMLEQLIACGAQQGTNRFVMGMPHRGRLNVLANVFHKPYRQIFMEFEDAPQMRGIQDVGDVKYHKGYVANRPEQNVMMALLPNPSHLEAVDPVVEGTVAAIQHQGEAGKEQSCLAVLMHGDAALSGQGVVYETFQLSRIPGYSTEGTLHIVVNNQIGFTAHPRESRSTPYCTDIAKMMGIPVFRVNSEDVLACLEVVEHALSVRERFHCDVIIDLCCYRKYGHNESDDPSVTAPFLYEEIKKKRPISVLLKERILNHPEWKISSQELDHIDTEIADTLNREFASLKDPGVEQWTKQECMHCSRMEAGELLIDNVDVSLDKDSLFDLSVKLCDVPEHFTLHAKVKALLNKRMSMANGDQDYDWGMAEEVAFASLLQEGFSLRLSGQDSIRGTFSQRQLVWTDIQTEDTFSPLYHVSSSQGSVELYNSPLSEYAVLGFEYGYAQQAERTLVIWEAQFGDFSNGAQIIFDQYISSGIQKWDLHSDLVVLLPHGYEGQGPEHSSARIERYLQLAANWNFQVVLPSTPVQYFRILREHTKRDLSLPLIVFTPKMLLRHPKCVSSIEDFGVKGGFKPFLEDANPNYRAKILVLCSGKIYYDYCGALPKDCASLFACIRVESLYPLYLEDLLILIGKYSQVEKYIWLQEEPQNMGAFSYFSLATDEIFPSKLQCVSRPRSSSTATGSASLSQQELSTLMETLFSIGRE
ncbi:2-oxoglutarate dehydrogenase E1 component [Chlamydia sp.]|uniref:2-oxoglutarate dehydrogenase E1 component n=1 Tax=Chlamydia sp. TaxID=35827 RepID=UPI0025C231D6|nr:2-oxoglutarate dehydrogenase E1 component [Chlamydia sp.]MBQ8498424.1 2-oxoglutarate dehydrogenase E1 component [Chlamydia sp.]